MPSTTALEPTSIGHALSPVRAAIEVVSSGVARTVVIHAEDGRALLPAARALARSAGVYAGAVSSSDPTMVDIVIRGVGAGG